VIEFLCFHNSLCEKGYVFVENLRPGVADGEGYSAQALALALAERNPGII
jgi:hypothetical protein